MEGGDTEQDLSDVLDALILTNSDFIVVIDGEELICDKSVLVKECDYFKAFDHFDHQTSKKLEIKGGIDFYSCKIIFDFLTSGELNIDLSNFQCILQACLFLQCDKAEEESVTFVSQHLGRDNVFNTYFFATSIGSRRLVNVCKFYIEKVFGQILQIFSSCGKIEPFLASSFQKVDQLLNSDFQCGEELMFFAVMGWVESDQKRKLHLESLLSKINFYIFAPLSLSSLKDDQELLEHVNIKEHLDNAASYKKLRIDSQIEFWNKKPVLRGRRWPKIIIAASTGNFQGGLQYLDLNKTCPTWKNLTKKPTELRKKSTGSTMVYHHPKLYFLGGEQNWQLTWYNVETNKWGVEQGIPPGRLLSGGAVVGRRLYLMGGVSIEDWDGMRGGTGQVVTSPSVDCYHLDTNQWEQVTEMDMSRSSPGLVVVDGKVWVFGGLKKRDMLQSCCCYDPEDDSWTDIADLPDKFAYFSCLVVGKVVWVMGGMGQDYKCRTNTYIFNTVDGSWSLGPSLNQPRKGAFGFYHNKKIYLCGGSMDGMKYLDTTEILDNVKGIWEMEKIGLKNWNCNVVCVSALQPVRFFTQK
eukprot:TRINITY_DN27284_c0_g1_i1.p1 TRINITY_DN27284_c0_g1~~TRINITY_DN27284_c0_g1_i1.p1  ORF type:complete len:579 (-),score=171.49 TRINITY_DN27284_c0_g1_i1:69-1805(-)